MSDEIAKCAWCGKEPEVSGGSDDYPRVYHVCELQPDWDSLVESWNNRQARILAARRRDFEAGQCSMKGCRDSDCMCAMHCEETAFDDYIGRRDD